jgi:hypothetical protein
MSKNRDLANLGSDTSLLATDAEVATSIAAIELIPTSLMTMGA